MTTSKQSKKTTKTSVRKVKPTKKQIIEAVEKTKSKAEEFLNDHQKAKKLLEDAVKKAKNFEKNRGPLAEVWSYFTAFFRLLRAYIRKEYREIAWGPMALVIVAILYFVSPFDLIPDPIPGGYVDDAAIIGYVIAQTKADLDNFMAWEVSRSDDEDTILVVSTEPE
ncbi:MAG TPA: YkvA family protein [Anaerolineaceae bacterium]|nr:YkvA family protein [Anaerolineaceae bacterium]